MIFWANLGLTYLAFSLAYVYCENVYRYAPVTSLLSPATLKTLIVTALMALSVLLGDKKTAATGQDPGLKEFLLRRVGSTFRSPFGALLPVALIGLVTFATFYCRFVRLEALPDDLRGVPLDVTVQSRKGDTPSPLKPAFADGSYLVSLRHADAGDLPELTISDALGFHKKSVNLAAQFSWPDYLLGNAVPATSWFDRSVLEPLSVGVETLDSNGTYHRYPGTLVPRADVPYFTTTEGFWEAAAAVATAGGTSPGSVVVRLPTGERYVGTFTPERTHLELTDVRARRALKQRTKLVERTVDYLRSRHPDPGQWNVMKFRDVYRNLSDDDRNDRLRLILHRLGVIPGWRDAKTPEQAEALARVMPELLWGYTWIADANVHTLLTESLGVLDSPVLEKEASAARASRARIAAPTLEELVQPFLALAACRGPDQYREAALVHIESVLRDRIRRGDSGLGSVLDVVTNAACEPLVDAAWTSTPRRSAPGSLAAKPWVAGRRRIALRDNQQ
jgi:hypothetical protein